MSIPLREYFALLWRYLREQHRWFALLAVFLIGGIALQLIVPQFTRAVIDTATAPDAVTTDPTGDRLTLAAVSFLIVALLQQVVSLSATYFGERVAWSATNALRADLFDHVLRLDMGFHHTMTPGTLIERIDGDVSQMADFFAQFFIRIVGSLLLAVGIIFTLFLEDWRVGIAFTAFAVISLVVLYRVRGIAIEPTVQVRDSVAKLTGYMEERLSGVEDLKANGAANYVVDGLIPLHETVRKRSLRAILFNSLFNSVSGLILTMGFATAFVSGYFLYESGALTLGGVYLVMNYMILLNRPLTDLSNQVERLQAISASVERVGELLNRPSAVQDEWRTDAIGERSSHRVPTNASRVRMAYMPSESHQKTTPSQPDRPVGTAYMPSETNQMWTGETIPPGALRVEFDGVTFGYQPDQPVLQDVTFSLEPGEVLGVVGRTGSGKTTLARLLFRLYDPQGGTIRLNDVPVREASLENVRKRIALVTQDVQLFEGSAGENLTFFHNGVTDKEIYSALDGLELDDWLRELPDGLATKIGAGGRGLSAGQAQLFAFARAMLRKPDLVILDEASARLDPATEARIERAVDRLIQGRTAILIAHRLATLDRADKIIVLEGGRIVESGGREALAADPTTRFYRLLQMGTNELLAVSGDGNLGEASLQPRRMAT